MTALNRKLLRDLMQMKGQAVAISLVIACGVATFILALSTVESLERNQLTYYDRYRFADVFTSLKRAPNALSERIGEIPGVAAVQTRVVIDVTLDVPGLKEPATGRLISIPERQRPALNDLHLRRGRWIEPGRDGEVLCSEAFAVAHKLQPGDSVRAVINGRRQQLRIVGIALSPEYVYQIRPGDIVPDDKRFAVFWMGYNELSNAYKMLGAFNDVSIRLTPGASEAEVIRRLDTLTAPYGGLGAYGRSDQTSNRFITDEITQLRGMAMIPPMIFLSVAAFLLNVVLARQISTQREQIAALKAFGYTHWEVGLHYLKLVLLITFVGVALGVAVGAYFGSGLTQMYTKFFRFPVMEYYLNPGVVAAAFLVSGGAAVLGTLGSVRKAVNLPPAEAMRPEPPADFKPTFVERLGLQRFFSAPARMIMRNLERQPVKSFIACFGISLAVSILVLGNHMEDSLDYLIEYEFEIAQRQDMTVMLIEPTSPSAIQEIKHLPGVLHCEPFRGLAVRLRHGHLSRRVAISGVEPGQTLVRLLDDKLQPIPIPAEGIVLTKKLAELLDVRIGETLVVEVLEGERPVRQAQVTGIAEAYVGMACYMHIDALHDMMREAPSITGVFLAVDPKHADELYRKLKDTPRVAGVNVKTLAWKSFEETLAEHLMRMRLFNISFASIIAFGVVYNSARISLSERSRELATMRVMGFTRAEISFVLLGELAILTLVAIPMGLAFGYGFAAWATTAMQTESHRMPFVVESSTFAFAATVTLVAALFSGLVVRRRLDHLDLVAVLKSRE